MGIYWKEATSTSLQNLIATDRLGLVTDMDGTISHIVENPEDAVVTPRNCELLGELRGKLNLLSVVSGRSLRNLADRMQLPGVVYIGNHGLERWVDGQLRYTFDLDRYRPMLESSVAQLKKINEEGIQVEDKHLTVTLHYRQAPDPQGAYNRLLPIVREVANRERLDFFEGRMIFELRPPVKANKGSAFAGLLDEFSLDGALYVGDDTTDVAALEVARDMRQQNTCYCLGAGVMSGNVPEGLFEEADLLVNGVSDVENLFAWILENRKS